MRSFSTFLTFPLSICSVLHSARPGLTPIFLASNFPNLHLNPNPSNRSFSLRLSDLNNASFLIASPRSFALHFLINLTGNRLLVYFAPLPAWCDLSLLTKSFVHPV